MSIMQQLIGTGPLVGWGRRLLRDGDELEVLAWMSWFLNEDSKLFHNLDQEKWKNFDLRNWSLNSWDRFQHHGNWISCYLFLGSTSGCSRLWTLAMVSHFQLLNSSSRLALISLSVAWTRFSKNRRKYSVSQLLTSVNSFKFSGFISNVPRIASCLLL